MIEPLIPPTLWGRYPTEFQPDRPPEALGNAGGLSGCHLWRVDSPSGPLMLRVWPQEGATRDRIDQIHRWLTPMRRLPWVAAPVADRQGATFQELTGRFWEVAPFLPGRADLERPPSQTHLTAMFAALARVHEALGFATTWGPSPGLIARRDELQQLITWEFAAMSRAIRLAVPDEARWLADRWLGAVGGPAQALVGRIEQAARQVLHQQPVLRDVRPDHFLFEGDRLTGLVDFGAMGVDSVAADLARLLGETVGRSEVLRRDALAAYEAIRSISAEDRGTIGVFEVANAVLGGARWVRWHFREGRQFADPDAVRSGLNRALVKLEEMRTSSG